MNRIAAGAFALGLAFSMAVGMALGVVPSPVRAQGSEQDPQALPQQRFLIIGTGAVTGVYYPAGGAICRLINQARSQHNIRCAVEATDGSASNLAAIRAGEIDMGVVQSDWQHHAYKGTARFRDVGPFSQLRSVFGLHNEPLTVLVRADAGIEKFDDIKGKRVNIGAPGSGNRATLETVMKAYGWTSKDFSEATELPVTEQAEALCENRVDVVAFTVGHPNSWVHDAAATCPIKLVQVNGAPVKRLIADNPFLARAVIPGGTYSGNEQETETFGVKATLVTSAWADADLVYEVVKVVFENFNEFQALHPALQVLNRETMVTEGLSAPLHDGAARYFKEAGLM